MKFLIVVKGFRYRLKSNAAHIFHLLIVNTFPFYLFIFFLQCFVHGFGVVERIAKTAQAIRQSNGSGLSIRKLHPFEPCAVRYPSKTISPVSFATNLSKNVNNSFKRCLTLPHKLSRYIFCWIAIFAFMTFPYRYAFYSRLLILKKFPEQVMFWPFRMQISNAFCCRDELCLFDVHYHHLPSPFSGKQLKAIPIAQTWKIETVPCVFTAASFCVFVY